MCSQSVLGSRRTHNAQTDPPDRRMDNRGTGRQAEEQSGQELLGDEEWLDQIENHGPFLLSDDEGEASQRAPAAKKRKYGNAATVEKKKASFPCIVCNNAYSSEPAAQRHMAARHHICRPVHQLKCQYCGSVFDDADNFGEHRRHSEDHLKDYFARVLGMERDQEMTRGTLKTFLESAACKQAKGLGLAKRGGDRDALAEAVVAAGITRDPAADRY